MENIIPKYERPIAAISDPISTVKNWDIALDAYDEGRFRDALIGVINYINPSLLKGVDTSGDVDFSHTQGSAQVRVQIKGDVFKVEAPFLKITEATNSVALIRKVAEVNFSPLTLVQIVLRDNVLWFEYEMGLSVCNPYKVYDIIREVCMYSDDYDDMFISSYKAEFYKEPQITALTEQEQEKVWNQISDVLNDYKNYSELFAKKRWTVFQWDIIITSLLKIANMPCVNGKLRSDLSEYVGNMSNGNIDFNFRIDKGTNFMKKLCDTPKEDILNDLYYADQFISLRWRSSASIITNQLERNIKQVDDYNRKEHYLDLSYYLQFVFLKLIYDYNLEENYKNAIHNALEKASGLESNRASKILSKLFYDMYDGKIDKTKANSDTKKKSFFSKLFS